MVRCLASLREFKFGPGLAIQQNVGDAGLQGLVQNDPCELAGVAGETTESAPVDPSVLPLRFCICYCAVTANMLAEVNLVFC